MSIGSPGLRAAVSPRIAATLCLLAVGPPLFAQATGVKKRRPLPPEYGSALMNARADKNGVAPVVFDHWLHRAKFTCRVCHVDLGFAMETNATGVKEDDNRQGYYCGACHNGKLAFGPLGQKTIGGVEVANCDRCHSQGKKVPREYDFASFTGAFARGRFGNNIDWEQTEKDGRVKLVDSLPGISIQRKPLQIPKDYDIQAKVETLPEIVFSHQKHAVWSGCELCHPDLFAVKRGESKYTMQDIFGGKYCGLCHGTVAFPVLDCQRCHTKPVSAAGS